MGEHFTVDIAALVQLACSPVTLPQWVADQRVWSVPGRSKSLCGSYQKRETSGGLRRSGLD
jgi:hypothetical protein